MASLVIGSDPEILVKISHMFLLKLIPILDNINLLYVAMTRAVDRLYGYIPSEDTENSEDREPKNVAQLIRKRLDALPVKMDGSEWSLGAPGQMTRTEEPVVSEVLREMPACSWRKKITVKRRADELWQLHTSAMKERIDRGILIHGILAGIHTADDIQKGVDAAIMEGLLPTKEGEELICALHSILDIKTSHGTVKDWFRSGLIVMNERTIAAETAFRPDRVVIEGRRAMVIDYKTGHPVPSDVGQVERYVGLLVEMGYAPVDGFLLYISRNEVVEI